MKQQIFETKLKEKIVELECNNNILMSRNLDLENNRGSMEAKVLYYKGELKTANEALKIRDQHIKQLQLNIIRCVING